ncbi:MAG: hypothetical protein Q9219_007271 [cf. Caloplaca sp. 3 TL-2023]
MLLDILFIYCKLNPDIGYRQDSTLSEKVSQDERPDQKLIRECCDAHYMEYDTFTIFGIIMQTVKSFYEMGSTTRIASSSSPSSSPIVERSQHIHEVYLVQADPDLAHHLAAIEILPQIFLIRWIRLLFGREFPLDDVLSIWDILFAEDPTLDLIDWICVSMLLRIRQQLLLADYSEALTLLLRYPVPPSSNGPSTFVEDALYLRQNIAQGGGSYIIDKYSERAPVDETRTKVPESRLAKRNKQSRKVENKKIGSPTMSPSRFLQEKGGIDAIIQEAAKGVYSKGERWGVNKALRGAVEGLQSGTSYSRRQLDGSRWSLDEGRHIPSMEKYIADIQTLEQRSRGLAKLLDSAIGELWEQQRQHGNENQDVFNNALSLSIAKIQFVQVYLENPTMPFAIENLEAETAPSQDAGKTTANDIAVQPDRSVSSEIRPNPQDSAHEDSKTPITESDQASKGKDSNPVESAPTITVSKSRPQPLPFHHPRPSLAQSSFSWMLGEDQRKSSFVSPSPFPADRRAAREKAEFLFGDGKPDSDGKTQKGKHREESEDEEIINLGPLKKA